MTFKESSIKIERAFALFYVDVFFSFKYEKVVIYQRELSLTPIAANSLGLTHKKQPRFIP